MIPTERQLGHAQGWIWAKSIMLGRQMSLADALALSSMEIQNHDLFPLYSATSSSEGWELGAEAKVREGK